MLGGLSLNQLALLNVDAKIAHEIRVHLEHCGFRQIKTEIDKDIAA